MKRKKRKETTKKRMSLKVKIKSIVMQRMTMKLLKRQLKNRMK